MARRRLGAARGAGRRPTRSTRRSPTSARFPDARGVPRRSRGRDGALAGRPRRAARGVHLARDRARLPSRAAPVAEHFPFPGSGALNRLCVHPAIVDFAERGAASTDLRLYQALTLGEVHRRDELRAADAHRPEPLVAPGAERRAVVARRDVPLPLRRDEGNAPTHLVPRARLGGRATTAPLVMPNGDPELYAAEQPAAGVRGRCSRTAPTCSTAVSTSPHPAPRVHPRRRLQARGLGLDRIPHAAVEVDLARLGRVRRRIDTARARALRLPASRSSDLGRGAARRDRPAALSEYSTSVRGARSLS